MEKLKNQKVSIKTLLKDIKNMMTICLKKIIRQKMKRIQSKLHKIGTYDVCKISLFCFVDKRYILNDGINRLAYFHKIVKS